MGVRPIQYSILVQIVRALYRIKIAHGVGDLVKKVQVRRFLSDSTPRTLLFDEKYKSSLSSRKDWETSTDKLSSNEEIWYTNGSKK